MIWPVSRQAQPETVTSCEPDHKESMQWQHHNPRRKDTHRCTCSSSLMWTVTFEKEQFASFQLRINELYKGHHSCAVLLGFQFVDF